MYEYGDWDSLEKRVVARAARKNIRQADRIRFTVSSKSANGTSNPDSYFQFALNGEIISGINVHSPENLKEALSKFTDIMIKHDLCDPDLLNSENKHTFCAALLDDLIIRYKANVPHLARTRTIPARTPKAINLGDIEESNEALGVNIIHKDHYKIPEKNSGDAFSDFHSDLRDLLDECKNPTQRTSDEGAELAAQQTPFIPKHYVLIKQDNALQLYLIDHHSHSAAEYILTFENPAAIKKVGGPLHDFMATYQLKEGMPDFSHHSEHASGSIIIGKNPAYKQPAAPLETSIPSIMNNPTFVPDDNALPARKVSGHGKKLTAEKVSEQGIGTALQ
jgi:hypothetical protein